MRTAKHIAQFVVSTQRVIEHVPTGKKKGIDVGLLAYSTDSEGHPSRTPATCAGKLKIIKYR